MPVGAAIGGASVLGAGASIYGANKAASTQANADNQAASLQEQQMATNSANAQPFISGGQGANNLLQSFYGLNGTSPALGQSALNAFSQSPDYQFALGQGTAALDNSAAAKGGMISGNQMQAQTQYGQGLATQNLQNYLGQLNTMSGQGVQAANGVAGTNTTGAAYTGRDIMGAGTAQAAGTLGTVAGVNSGVNNFLTAYKGMSNSSYGTPSYSGQTGTQNIGNYTMPQF